MNILWQVENVVINFYTRKWGRNVKQTALNIERGPYVKSAGSGITSGVKRRQRWNKKQGKIIYTGHFVYFKGNGWDKPVYQTAFSTLEFDHF